MINIDAQIARVKKLYPQFEVKIATDWLVVFEGWLSPFRAKKYQIRITMCMPYDIESGEIQGYAPRVEIIEPRVIMSAPHLYKNEVTPENALLCLYDPLQTQWTYDDYIAETSIPWAIRWLASYEGWCATGEWTGGGRDHGQINDEEKSCRNLDKKDQKVRFNKSVFNFLGQKIGTYASFPLMAAASREYFRPLSWHDWKINSSMVSRLAITSTTFAELQLVA